MGGAITGFPLTLETTNGREWWELGDLPVMCCPSDAWTTRSALLTVAIAASGSRFGQKRPKCAIRGW